MLSPLQDNSSESYDNVGNGRHLAPAPHQRCSIAHRVQVSRQVGQQPDDQDDAKLLQRMSFRLLPHLAHLLQDQSSKNAEAKDSFNQKDTKVVKEGKKHDRRGASSSLSFERDLCFARSI